MGFVESKAETLLNNACWGKHNLMYPTEAFGFVLGFMNSRGPSKI